MSDKPTDAWRALSLFHRRAFGILSDKFADLDQLKSAQNHAQWADMIDDLVRDIKAAAAMNDAITANRERSEA